MISRDAAILLLTPPECCSVLLEIDSFTHPKTGKQSNCYRVTYRSMERSLTDDEINVLQDTLRDDAAGKLSVELR